VYSIVQCDGRRRRRSQGDGDGQEEQGGVHLSRWTGCFLEPERLDLGLVTWGMDEMEILYDGVMEME
jgi:hypothetical protein